MESKRQLYIVISQTGTILSRILKLFTGAEYNHASVSLSSDLQQMYSFGRLHPYNPFWGGFVKESPNTGTFKRFYKTKAVVLAVDIDEEKYIELCEFLRKMHLQRRNYSYNYLGVCLAAFRITYRRRNCYYCSEFVRDMLLKGEVNGAEMLKSIVQPIHFFTLPHKKLFVGRLSEYSDDLLHSHI
ncbi:MAG: hypothetical protein IJY79_09165 [Clostridia bacterium]|nr:hypothetical protein [Clostridia bacterium]